MAGTRFGTADFRRFVRAAGGVGFRDQSMTTPSAIRPAPPELRKKYRVIAKLGEGGMAHIHLAVALGVGGVRKLVVLKSIRPELVAVADERMREMFLTEARLAATFNHPNIVQTFEVAVVRRRAVLLQEYLG